MDTNTLPTASTEITREGLRRQDSKHALTGSFTRTLFTASDRVAGTVTIRPGRDGYAARNWNGVLIRVCETIEEAEREVAHA